MMKTLSDIAYYISFPSEVPKPFGAMHIISLVFTAVITFVIVRMFKTAEKRYEKRLFLIAGIILILGELYKQFVITFRGGFSYAFFFFPMQFCSTPLYAFPLAFFAKNEKLYEGAVFYSATYCVFAGALVLIYPSSVFCNSGAINVQSLIHHAVMVAVGIALLSRYFGRFTAAGVAHGVGIFTFFLFVAVGINLAMGEGVNMYYLNPLSPIKVPVLSFLSRILPFPVVPILYAVVFTGIAIVISGVLFRRKRSE